ncbi:DUF3883 domain-containing protein [Mycoplasma sp. P36-A1]|uniref:DUF3883 domain-containing protein n=1 Tax=Mycoplasma sp. P36-A1 TaxID=3252900 RepID=UPI003C2F6E58
MFNYKDFLPEATENQKAFILDHGKTTDEEKLKYSDGDKSYGWKIRRYGKLKVGAVVLNRHPARISKGGKWEIYGGGYVNSISGPDESGNVTAEITHAFKIEPTICKGDSFIENFNWKTPNKKKRKKPNSWVNFWDQSGMNEIIYEDFVALIENQHLVPIDDTKSAQSESEITDDEVKKFEQESTKGFTVLIDEVGPNRPNTPRKQKFIGRNTDWDRVNKSKQKLGVLGEEIVFDLLLQEAVINDLVQPVHASKKEGDGLGYDIRAFDQANNVIRIEVKTSKAKYSDGFVMTANEIKVSQEAEPYKIYFVHDLDVKLKEVKIKIYDGPVTEKNFIMDPSTYKIYQK